MVKTFTKNEKNVIRIMVAAVIIAAAIFIGILYVNDYYRATEKAQRAILGSDRVKVVEEEDYYVFTQTIKEDSAGTSGDLSGTGKGIIFYPGGKVDEVAYAPMLLELAEYGYEVYLVKMPAKLAIFGKNAAEDIIEDNPHIKEWTMMGHSLGGAMAADFCASHDGKIDGLVLLAAYSMKDLTKTDVQVFSFYGTEDEVLNAENYEKYRENLPKETVEVVIDGGNHAYYAHYGEQEGDGKATITRAEQQECVIDLFISYQ